MCWLWLAVVGRRRLICPLCLSVVGRRHLSLLVCGGATLEPRKSRFCLVLFRTQTENAATQAVWEKQAEHTQACANHPGTAFCQGVAANNWMVFRLCCPNLIIYGIWSLFRRNTTKKALTYAVRANQAENAPIAGRGRQLAPKRNKTAFL